MNDYRRYAPVGLAISGLALLTLIGVIVIRAMIAIQVITPPDPALYETLTWASLAAVFLGLAITALLNPDGVRKFVTGRQMQYGSNSIILLLAFIGVLIFVNIIVMQNPRSWDLTEDQQNTFAPETIDVVKKLPQTVTARAYYSGNIGTDEISKLLNRYKQESNGKFEYELIDPEFNPAQAVADGVVSDGTVVLAMGEQKENINYPSEQDITGALIRLMNPEKRPIYFITGHGERSLESDGSQRSYSAAKLALEGKNYIVNSLSLRSTGSVPADAKVVVLAGPQTPLDATEVAALEAYLAAGGSLVVMQDPSVLTQFEGKADPMTELLAKWGIAFNDDYVFNPNIQQPNIAMADPTAYGQHPITEKLMNVYTIFPESRSLVLSTDNQMVSVSPLALSDADSWGETDLAGLKAGSSDIGRDDKDNLGPLTLAAVAEDYASSGRLVVFGTSQIGTDEVYSAGYGTIFINTIDWAAKNENTINLTAKTPTERQFQQPDLLQTILIFLGSLCLIPLLIVGAGVWSWMARRRRG